MPNRPESRNTHNTTKAGKSAIPAKGVVSSCAIPSGGIKLAGQTIFTNPAKRTILSLPKRGIVEKSQKTAPAEFAYLFMI